MRPTATRCWHYATYQGTFAWVLTHGPYKYLRFFLTRSTMSPILPPALTLCLDTNACQSGPSCTSLVGQILTAYTGFCKPAARARHVLS